MAVAESVGLLTELSSKLNHQLIEATSDAKKSNVTDLVRAYTAFFTAYNLVVSYSHEKTPSKDKVLEQLDVVKSAVQAFSKDSNLSEQLRRLDEIMGSIRSGKSEKDKSEKKDKPSKAKPHKGRYEELVEVVQARFPENEDSHEAAVAIGAAETSPVYRIGGDFQTYYSRVYTVFQLVLGDLEKLSKAPPEEIADYYSRVLPVSLGDLLGEPNNDEGRKDSKSVRELLAMSAGDYLKWLLKRVSLDHYIHDQSQGLLQLLKSSGIDAGVNAEITNSIVRAVAAVKSLQNKREEAACQLAEGIFREVDEIRGEALTTVTKSMEKAVEEIQAASGSIYQYHGIQDGIMKIYTPDLPADHSISGTALRTPILVAEQVFTDPKYLAELRAVLMKYIERLDLAYKILLPVEKYYVEMLTSMAEVGKNLRSIVSSSAIETLRMKLVDAYVRLTLLKELWNTRTAGFSVDEISKQRHIVETLLSRLESSYPGIPKLYNGELNMDAVTEIVRLY